MNQPLSIETIAAMYNALMVIQKDPKIRFFLVANDPNALKQVEAATKMAETEIMQKFLELAVAAS